MSQSLHENRIKAAEYVVAAYYAAKMSPSVALNIFRGIRDNNENSQAYDDATARLRSALHGLFGKRKPRVGISVAEACVLLDSGQNFVQEHSEALGYSAKYPFTERYDYHLVRAFGVAGNAKAGRLVATLSSGGVTVGSFLGTTAQLEHELANGATLSLMTVPNLIASRWRDLDELELWRHTYIDLLDRVRRS
jgi:hypothetical protein